MKQIEINPKQAFAELQAMQAKERTRLINEALEGRELTPVQRKRLKIELEFSTRFENGELLPVDEDGTPLTDPHGWPLNARDYIKQTATALFTSSPGTPPAKAPTNGQELFDRMRTAKSEAERAAIYKAFKGG